MKRTLFKDVGRGAQKIGLVVAVASALAIAAAGCGNLTEGGPVVVTYAPSGEMMAFLDGEVRFFDADAQHALGSMPTLAQIGGGWEPFSPRYASSRDGTTVAVGTNLTVQVYSVDTRKNIASIVVNDTPHETYPIRGVALSPQGDLLAVCVLPIFVMAPPRLAIWRVSDQTLVADIAAPAGRPGWGWHAGLAFSPDGGTLYGIGSFSVDDQKPPISYVTAWNTTTGNVVWETEVPAQPIDAAIDSLTISADGATLATAGSTIRLWHTADGTQLAFHMDPITQLVSMGLSPDGQNLVVTQATNVVADPQVIGPDGAIIWNAPIHASESGCSSAVFSPDGTRVAAACTPELRVWNAQTGALIQHVKVTSKLY